MTNQKLKTRPATDIDPKVAAGGVGAAASVVIIFVASSLGFEIPETVAAAAVLLVSFAVGYFKKGD